MFNQSVLLSWEVGDRVGNDLDVSTVLKGGQAVLDKGFAGGEPFLVDDPESGLDDLVFLAYFELFHEFGDYRFDNQFPVLG